MKEECSMIENIPIDLIDSAKCPLRQLRNTTSSFRSLVDSIRAHGILHNLTLRRKKGGRYEVIDGHHRLQAAKESGLTVVPCKIIEATDFDTKILQIQANAQTVRTQPYEFALFLKSILVENPELTIKELALMVSRYPAWVASVLKLTHLAKEVIEKIEHLPLQSQVEISKLPKILQIENLNLFLRLDKQSIKLHVANLLRKAKQEALSAKDRLYEEFRVEPIYRSMKQILKEIETGLIACVSLTGSDKAADGWKKALKWAVHLDEISRNETMEKLSIYADKRNKKLRKKQKNERIDN